MTILDEAAAIVAGDRQSAYGTPGESWGRTAALWSAILGVDVTPHQAVLCMIALKLSREAHRHSRDNLVDIAGYAAIAEVVNR